MRQLYALITAAILYAVFCLSINPKFAGDFVNYLVEN